jgi:hypothetical protein
MAARARARATAKLVPRRAPARGRMLEIEVLARETGLHPDLVRRLVRLGMVEAAGGTAQNPLFRPDAPSRLARALRLRRDLGLNYSGAALACELLARIDELEERLRRVSMEPPTIRER